MERHFREKLLPEFGERTAAIVTRESERVETILARDPTESKHVFQVHGADAAGHMLFRKRITRVKLLSFLAAQARCVVAMEACAGAPLLGA